MVLQAMREANRALRSSLQMSIHEETAAAAAAEVEDKEGPEGRPRGPRGVINGLLRSIGESPYGGSSAQVDQPEAATSPRHLASGGGAADDKVSQG